MKAWIAASLAAGGMAAGVVLLPAFLATGERKDAVQIAYDCGMLDAAVKMSPPHIRAAYNQPINRMTRECATWARTHGIKPPA